MQPLRGVIHGSSIQLTASPGLPDGQQVEVIVLSTKQTNDEATRNRLASFKGVPDWSEEDDLILDEIAKSRRSAAWREVLDSDDAG